MPQIPKETIQKTCIYLKKIKAFTIDQLASSLNCSIPSARLKLKQWNSYTSYNRNGRFYTLPSIPSFDEHGLWQCHGSYFSRHGNLKKTIIRVVHDSSSGLTGKELGVLLDLSPQSFLHHFRTVPGMYREKHGGVYIYFSDNAATYQKQMQHRLNGEGAAEPPLCDADVVIILATLLKHPSLSLEEITVLPELQAYRFSAGVIREWLNRHDLLKKTQITPC